MGSRRLASFSPPYIYPFYLPSIQSGYSTGSFGCPTVQCCTEPFPVCGASCVGSSGMALACYWSVILGHSNMVNTCLLDRSEQNFPALWDMYVCQ